MMGSSVSYAFASRIKEDSMQSIRKRETIGFNTDFKAGSSQNEPKRIPAGNLPVFVFSLYRKELGKFKREKAVVSVGKSPKWKWGVFCAYPSFFCRYYQRMIPHLLEEENHESNRNCKTH